MNKSTKSIFQITNSFYSSSSFLLVTELIRNKYHITLFWLLVLDLKRTQIKNQPFELC